jgi:hypothetical protein
MFREVMLLAHAFEMRGKKLGAEHHFGANV